MILNEKYNRDDFVDFLKNQFLTDFSKDIRSVSTNGLSSITKAYSLGSSKELDLQVFEFEYTGSSKKRIALTKEALALMRDSANFRALAVFHKAESEEWRFSLMTATPVRNDKGKVGLSYSNPKRYSFLLGEYAKINTPTKFLITRGKIIDFNDLKSRFSVEVVNKEFYKDVSESFNKLVGGTLVVGKKKQTFDPQLKLPSISDHSQTSLEFAVRLIGRIIFCWFLREKRSPAGNSLMPKELVSLESVKNIPDYYHKILEPIFFEILNKPQKSRIEPFDNELFSQIPYLNGGLFSPQEDDFYKRYKTDLQSQYNNTLTIPDGWICSLFEILETYNFTIDENTSYDEELSIDPEMLGRIFENLLAEINPETGESARKSTGSYYTPRVIVDYMVDESLSLYLKEKTNIDDKKIKALISYDLEDDENNCLTEIEKDKIIESLGELKILDPACGSGAFPIGMLQKIVFILQQVDPNAKKMYDLEIKHIAPELKRFIQKEYDNGSFDYLRKLRVIRDCIYGIDIQSIATEISRLRCFLTLVVDQKIDDTLDNRGIQPLPNLDFKFVTANSLIGLPKIDKTQSSLFDNYEKIDELKNVRDDYFSATGLEREQLKTEFVMQQKRLVDQLIKEHGFMGVAKAELTQKLTDWEPFTHKATSWFDLEWMFGIKDGFDIVIANPPYVDSEAMTKNGDDLRSVYKKIYTTAKGNWDLFVIFIEKGFRLLKKDGVISYIVPNKLIGATYTKDLKKFMSTMNICTLRDYSNIDVFKEVSVYPVVFVAENSVTKNNVLLSIMESETKIKYEQSISPDLFYADIFWDKFFLQPKELSIILKLCTFERLSSLVGSNICDASTVSEAYNLKKYLNELVDNKINYKKIINTGTIDPYSSLWGKKKTQYIKDSYSQPIVLDSDLKLLSSRRFQQASSNKIIVAGMSKRIESYYDNGQYLAGKSTSIILENKNNLVPIKYILGLMNSKLMSFWITKYFNSIKMAGGFLNIGTKEIGMLPIKKTEKNIENLIINNVENILILKNQDIESDTKKIESEIDQLVYKLYDLTDDEIKIVEESVK